MEMQSVAMRAYQADCRPEVAKLLEKRAGWPGTEHTGNNEDFWEWKYERNPLGITLVSLACEGGEPIAHAGVLPTKMKIGPSVHLAAQWSSDIFTRPDRRGLQLTERTAEHLGRQERESGILVDFMFPSAAGYELVSGMGFREAPVRFAQYELIINPGQFFARVRMGQMKKLAFRALRLLQPTQGKDDDVDTVISDLFPEDVEILTRAFELRFDLIVRRSRAYLEWRYADPSGGRFILLLARRKESTVGYAVLRPYAASGRPFMDIVDLVAMPENPSALRSLVGKAVEVGRDHGSDALHVWLPTDHPLVTELGRAGFLLRQPRQGERAMRLMVRCLAPGSAEEVLTRPGLRAHLVLGDTDWV